MAKRKMLEIDDKLWRTTKKLAKARGMLLSAYWTAVMKAWVERHPRKAA